MGEIFKDRKMNSPPASNRTSCKSQRPNKLCSPRKRCVFVKAIRKGFALHKDNPASTDCHDLRRSPVVEEISFESLTIPSASLRMRNDLASTNARHPGTPRNISTSVGKLKDKPHDRLPTVMEGGESVASVEMIGNIYQTATSVEPPDRSIQSSPTHLYQTCIPCVSLPMRINNATLDQPQPCTDGFDARVDAQHRHMYRHLNNSALSLNPDMYYFPGLDLGEEKVVRRVGADLLDRDIGISIGAEAYFFSVFVAERFGLL